MISQQASSFSVCTTLPVTSPTLRTERTNHEKGQNVTISVTSSSYQVVASGSGLTLSVDLSPTISRNLLPLVGFFVPSIYVVVRFLTI